MVPGPSAAKVNDGAISTRAFSENLRYPPGYESCAGRFGLFTRGYWCFTPSGLSLSTTFLPKSTPLITRGYKRDAPTGASSATGDCSAIRKELQISITTSPFS